MSEKDAQGRAGRRRRLVFALVLASLCLAIAALWFLNRTSITTAPVHTAQAPSAVSGDDEAPGPPRAAPAAATPTEPDAPVLPDDDPIALYRKQTRYAPTSGVLAPTALDLLEPNRRYERFVPIGDTVDRGSGEEIRFLFTADKYYYEGDEDVKARLEVQRSGRAVPIDIQLSTVEAEGGSGRIGEAKPLAFDRDGDVHRARIDLAESFPEHHGPLRLVVRFGFGEGEAQEADLRVFTTPANSIPGRFLGRYRDAPQNGSLLVEAAVEIFDAGFYRFDANLFAHDGAPLAFANFKGHLEPGVRWIPLEFFGLLLIDLGASGPYEVRNLRGYRFLDGHYPDRLRLRDATTTYWTHGYALASFSDEEFTSPEKQRVLELLELDAQQGIALDLPEVANGP